MKDYRTPLAAILLLATPAALHAQLGDRTAPRPGLAPGLTATALLDARRMLELTPRQVARLDSLERVQLRRRAEVRRQLAALRDSVCPRQQRCDLSADQRLTLRDRMRGLRDVRGDSMARVAALNVLDSTQRGRVQGWRMRRGAEMRMAMRRGAGPMGQGRGMAPRFRRPLGPGQDGPWAGPRARGEWRGGFGPGVGPGVRPLRPMRPPVDAPRRRPGRGEEMELPDSGSVR